MARDYGGDANALFNSMVEGALARSDQDLQMLQGVDQNSVDAYFATQAALGQSLPITSSVRSPESNAAVGGADASKHLESQGASAIDFDISRLTPEQRSNLPNTMRGAGFTGVGQYPEQNFAQGDTRETPASWGGQGSLMEPSQQQSLMQEPQGGVAPNPMDTLLSQMQQDVAQPGATQGLNYDDILASLTEGQPSKTKSTIARMLMSLSESAGAMGIMGVGKGNTRAGLIASERAGQRRSSAQSTASMAATLSEMPNGMKYAQAIAQGAPVDQIMTVYNNEQSNQWKNEASVRDKMWDAAKLKVTQGFTTQEREAGQVFSGGQGDLNRAVDIREQNIRAKTAANREAGTQGRWEEDAKVAKNQYDDKLNRGVAAGGTAKTMLTAMAKATGNQTNIDAVAGLDEATLSNPAAVSSYMTAFGKQLPSSGPSTVINVGGEDPEAAAAAAQAELDIKIAELGFTSGLDIVNETKSKVAAAEVRLSEVKNAQRLLASGVTTGPFMAAWQPIGEWLLDLNVLSPDGGLGKGVVGRSQQISGFNRVFPGMRIEGSGSMSDWEGKINQQAYANINTSEEANTLSLDVFESLAKRQIARANAQEDWLYENKNLRGFDRDWSAKVKAGDPSTAPMGFDTDYVNTEMLRANVAAGNLNIGDTVYRTVEGELVGKVIENQAMMDALLKGDSNE